MHLIIFILIMKPNGTNFQCVSEVNTGNVTQKADVQRLREICLHGGLHSLQIPAAFRRKTSVTLKA